jgi:alpha-tubulin suppressor-like RCC1 family protein
MEDMRRREIRIHSLAALLLAALATPAATNPYRSEILSWGGRQFLTRPVASFALATGFALALQDDGKVAAWGEGGYCQACAIPIGLDSVVAVATSGDKAILLRSNGRVVTIPSTTAIPDSLPPIAAIAGGGSTVLALGIDGRVRSWGPIAAPTDSLHDVVSLSMSGDHALALRSDGSIIAWGNDNFGQCRVPPGLPKATAVAAGGVFSMALLVDGSVVVWGDTTGSRSPPPTLRAVAIAAGSEIALAIRPDSTIAVWGTSRGGNAVGIPAGLKVVQVESSSRATLALLPDGTLRSFGTAGWSNLPEGRTGIRSIQASESSLFVDAQDGSITLEGSGTDTLRRPTTSSAAPRDLRPYVGCKTWLDGDGRLVVDSSRSSGWGARPTGFDTLQAIACASGGTLLLGRSQGTPYFAQWGSGTCDFPNQCDLPIVQQPVASLSLGENYVAGLTPEGTLFGWGEFWNARPDTLPKLVSLASSNYETYGLDVTGRVHLLASSGSWSAGKQTSMPAGLSEVTSLQASLSHFLALRKDGSVVGWGHDELGQASPPTDLPPAKAVAAAFGYSTILLRDAPPDESATVRRSIPHRAPGTYPLAAISIAGRLTWKGRGRWNGSAWEAPIPPGRWIVAVPGESSRGASILVRFR